MSDDFSPKTYFWPYDVFGYLLPGLTLLVGLGLGNEWGAKMLGPLWTKMRLGDAALALGLAYVLGHVVAGMSSLVFEKWIVSKWLRWPTSHMFRSDRERGLARILIPSYQRPYSERFREAFDARFLKVFSVPPDDEHDRFWLVWSYVSLHHPLAYRRGTHFLELYGFSRNVSFSCFLVALLPVLPQWSALVGAIHWIAALTVASIFLFINYTKLLRRLNDEVYRAFVAIAADEHAESSGR